MFLVDLNILEIQSLEKLLKVSDETDLKLLGKIAKKGERGEKGSKSYLKISEELFMSESSVKYRLKRLLAASGIESISKMSEIVNKYLKESLQS